jgi:hypothetical protein
MKFSIALALIATCVSAQEERELHKIGKKLRSKKNAVCVIGCTPYVNPADPNKGINKFKALVDDMTDNCDVIVHNGDTKAGSAPCTKSLMTEPLHIIADAAKAKGVAFIYAIGDNENNDCHRDGSKVCTFTCMYTPLSSYYPHCSTALLGSSPCSRLLQVRRCSSFCYQ